VYRAILSCTQVKFLPTPQQVQVSKVRFPVTEAQRRQDNHKEVDEEVEGENRQKREFVLVDENKDEPEEVESDREGRALRRPTRQNGHGVYGNRGVRTRPRR